MKLGLVGFAGSGKTTLLCRTIEALGDRPVADSQMAACCLAGLWLWYDYLDESHSISQGISASR